MSMPTKAQITRLMATGKVVDIIEGKEGRFFVHLKEGYDFGTDPCDVIRTKSFALREEAAAAVRDAKRVT